jgi:hypothetical protein
MRVFRFPGFNHKYHHPFFSVDHNEAEDIIPFVKHCLDNNLFKQLDIILFGSLHACHSAIYLRDEDNEEPEKTDEQKYWKALQILLPQVLAKLKLQSNEIEMIKIFMNATNRSLSLFISILPYLENILQETRDSQKEVPRVWLSVTTTKELKQKLWKTFLDFTDVFEVQSFTNMKKEVIHHPVFYFSQMLQNQMNSNNTNEEEME